ncbi:hypothetical protein FITA111629_14505 [Filibacter tadaridae]|uniref:Uncharacterized protein n=1 Tax=Filibacter tadaridae TaxID=2483811 RepID=A0A3P5X5R7_9BACL|nr:hypothetical protein FILTAD_00896 [Filibacter tadaridae]
MVRHKAAALGIAYPFIRISLKKVTKVIEAAEKVPY